MTAASSAAVPLSEVIERGVRVAPDAGVLASRDPEKLIDFWSDHLEARDVAAAELRARSLEVPLESRRLDDARDRQQLGGGEGHVAGLGPHH